jgi:hypothetical protein
MVCTRGNDVELVTVQDAVGHGIAATSLRVRDNQHRVVDELVLIATLTVVPSPEQFVRRGRLRLSVRTPRESEKNGNNAE